MMFFSVLPSIKPDLLNSLNWSCNNIDEKFFDFLDRAPKLTSIYLDGIIADDSLPLKYLRDFIHANETIEFLSVRGVGESKLSQGSLTFLFNVFKDNVNLNAIDFSNHNYGEQGLKNLSTALQETKHIHNISFSPCGVFSKKIFDEFFSDMNSSLFPIHFGWPEEEMKAMLQSEAISSDDYKNYRSQYDSITSIFPQTLVDPISKPHEQFIPIYRQNQNQNPSFYPSFKPVQSEQEFYQRVHGIFVPEIPEIPASFFEERTNNLKNKFKFDQLYAAVSSISFE